MMVKNETLILGIGNTLLSDEGAGIHALNILQSLYSNTPELNFLDGGTLSFTLAVWIEDCSNLIVLDAAELNSTPGTVKTFIGDEMDGFLGKAKRTPHEVGLLDLMDIARITENLPKNRALIGIQPEKMSWGMMPTEQVQKSLDDVVHEASKLISLWNNINVNQQNIV